jgi:conjugative transfer signal peptidase TraF
MNRHRSALLVAAAGLAGIALICVGAVRPRVPRLVWNLSASAPEGLYEVTSADRLAVGDMVIARIPAPYRTLAATRRYIPQRIPLVKQIVAGPGDQICALGDTLFLNGVRLADRRRRDGAGRIMPVWQGCIRLRPGQLFLLMRASPLSFDGRYFGITDRRDIIGKARLLWAR